MGRLKLKPKFWRGTNTVKTRIADETVNVIFVGIKLLITTCQITIDEKDHTYCC